MGAAWVALSVGCSAIIEPDLDRLGAPLDAGAPRDAAAIDGAARDAGTPDGGAACPASCDDGHACTTDACEGARCVHTTDDDACGDGERCSPLLGCVPERCTRDEECDDAVHCNGAEHCEPGTGGTGCVAGDPPVCDDGASCTTDACDAATDACAHVPDHAACADAVDCTADRCAPGTAGADDDGCTRAPDDAMCALDYCVVGRVCDAAGGCVGGSPRDCGDANACTDDDCDEAADACTHDPRDDDGDGFAPRTATGAGGVMTCAGGEDCDDDDASRNPDAVEACDREDDDCDGDVDEGCEALPDTCADAQTITLDGAGEATVTGTLGAVGDDYESSFVCGATGRGGRDAIYALALPIGTWDVEIDTFGSAANTVLAVAAECTAAGLGVVCNDDATRPGTASRMWAHRIGSNGTTRLFIMVDGYSSAEVGAFTLNVRRTPARADECLAGTARPLDISGGGTVVGFQTEGLGTARGSCQVSWDTSGEATLALTASTGVVDMTVYSVDFSPDVYLRRGCAGAELGCDTGADLGGGLSTADLRESVTIGEDYFFFVDGGSGSYVVFYEPY